MMAIMRRHDVAVALVACSSLFLGGVHAQDFFVNSTTLSAYTSDTKEPIAYRCAFINQWEQELQPIDYPVGKKYDAAHWGPPLVVSHNSNYQLWCSGCNASSAFANYADTGKTAVLGTDIQDNFNNSFSFTFGATFYVQFAMGQNLNSILVDGQHPFISAAARAKPSPDWFTGFYNFNTVDERTKRFYQTFSINTFPWTAGIDGGQTYKARPLPLDEPRPISIFTYTTTPSGVFITADKTVVPVAVWSCELMMQKFNEYGDKIYVNLTAPPDSTSDAATRTTTIYLVSFLTMGWWVMASWWL